MAADVKPIVFLDKNDLPSALKTVDAYTSAVKELFFVRNPKLRKKTPEGEIAYSSFLASTTLPACWIFYPETSTLVHALAEELYFELRTARNRNIITAEDQKKYRDATIGIAGLSVGSSAVAALVQSGGPKNIKIADFDTVEISNLNRIRARLTDIGTNKTEVAAREAWLIDPFAELELWDAGITKETIEKFIIGEPKLDIFVDQMDSLDLKIIARQICREHKIPVLMATDNGNGVILDVERFDTERNLPLLHGNIKNEDLDSLKGADLKTWLSLAVKIIGPENLTPSIQKSVQNIGKSLAAIPQLGPTAAIAGTMISFAVRQIANNQLLPTGRYIFNLESILVPEYNNAENIDSRKKAYEEFCKNT